MTEYLHVTGFAEFVGEDGPQTIIVTQFEDGTIQADVPSLKKSPRGTEEEVNAWIAENINKHVAIRTS